MVIKPKRTIDELALAWVCRELHPVEDHDSCVYLCLVRPTKLFYPGGFYFWRVPDPSLKIKMPAGLAVHIKINPGELLPLLKPIENKET